MISMAARRGRRPSPGGRPPGRPTWDGHPRVALDLFSGTGGGTAAFVGRGWQVVRVDLDRRHHPTVLADVGRLPIGGPVNFLWASPPCTEFSMADARVDHRTKRPSLDLVVAALAAVRDLRPRFWVLENVRGAIPFLGIPVQKIGPWCLWGYFPPVAVTLAMQTYLKRAAGPTAIDRAAIPYELSVAVADAVERWWAVPSLLDLRPFRKHRHQAAAAVRPDGRDAAPEGLFTTGAYVCTVCRRVPVDAENGYDTCPSCLALV